MQKKMSELCPGEKGTVLWLTNTGAIRRRLTDIGLTAGTEICCLNKNPFGDPTAYRIRGAVMALRKQDAAHIYLETGRRTSWG